MDYEMMRKKLDEGIEIEQQDDGIDDDDKKMGLVLQGLGHAIIDIAESTGRIAAALERREM